MTKEKDKTHNIRTEITRYRSGKIRSKYPYVNGKKHGLGEWRWESGQKRRESTRKEGKLRGMETEWYENGQKWGEIYYIEDKEYAWIEWNVKGNITAVNFPPRSPIISPIVTLKYQVRRQIS